MPRLSPLFLAALLSGCAAPKPLAEAPAPPPVIEIDGPVEKAEPKETPDESHDESRDEAKDKARELEKEVAQNAGILGLMRAGEPPDGGAFGGGGLVGDPIDASSGYGGLGLSGIGKGGGGTGGPIPLGSIGTIGHNKGVGTGYGSGKKSGARVSTGSGNVQGSLSKDIIRRVIRRRIKQVRHCYERQLQREPTLEGKVGIKFVIDAAGKVSSAKIETGMHRVVDRCVQRVILALRFPKPKGGGIVVVSYPFVFKHAANSKQPAKSAKPAKPAKP